jgi:hypothetical protein
MSLPLPNARNIWKCTNKNPNNAYQTCNQEIYKDEKDGLVKNFKDGHGGIRGKRHECPYRVGSPQHHTGPKDGNWKRYWFEHNEKMENLPCGLCGEKFNSIKMPVCPNCYKQKCRKCESEQQWISGEKVEMNKCRSCGHDKLDLVETYYGRKKLNPNFKTAKEMMCIALLSIFIVSIVISNYVYGITKNVTIEMSTGEYTTCYMTKKVEQCNTINIDNNRFRLLNSFNEFLAYGPDLEEEEEEDD